MNILVTGGAGYIGSHCVQHLLQEGDHEVVVYDNLSTGSRSLVVSPYFVRGDIQDKKHLIQTLKRFDIQAVMHFAASAIVTESVDTPDKYYASNVNGSLQLLSAMREVGVDQFIYSSSCSVYGNPMYTPLDENHPLDPVNPYGFTKRVVERMLSDFSYAYGLRYVSLRYFNAAGACANGQIGEIHEPETHIIPLILQTLTGHRKEFIINGTDYDTTDGTCIRDYVHVSDITQAHLLALDYLSDGGRSTVFNIGSEQGHSVREVLTACENVTQQSIPVAFGPRRPGDPPILVASAKKIRKALRWQPTYTDLEDIIRTAWLWEQERSHTFDSPATDE